ncbi:MAG: metallophosphoesterase family protein [Clostridiales Family XIII bacterium]|jgi:predicted phosphodiesterase|nr:metallophosphoesterase family protein [Clostridiales Family XIII bacterium]
MMKKKVKEKIEQLDDISENITDTVAPVKIFRRDRGRQANKKSLLRKILLGILSVLIILFILIISLYTSFRTANVDDRIASIPINVRFSIEKHILIDFGAPGSIEMGVPKIVGNPFKEVGGVIISVKDITALTNFSNFISGNSDLIPANDLGKFAQYYSEESDRVIHNLLYNLIWRFIIYAVCSIVIAIALVMLILRIRKSFFGTVHASIYTLVIIIAVVSMTYGIREVNVKTEERSSTQLLKQGQPVEVASTAAFSIDTPVGALTFNGAMSMPAERINTIVTDTDTRGWEFSNKATTNVKDTVRKSGYFENRYKHYMVHITDIHDNIYMYPVVAQIVKSLGASTVLDTGDVTKTGSSLEGVFVSSYVSQLKEAGAEEIYYIRGNHDSKTTDSQMKNAGAIVLNGIQTMANGLTIAGYPDPLHTNLYDSIHTDNRTKLLADRSDKIVDELTEYLDKNEKRVNLLLVHPKKMGNAAQKAGLFDIELSGHTHKPEPVITTGESISIEGNNTNGEVQTGQNEMFGTAVGPIRRDVIIDILMYDRIEKSYNLCLLTVKPDGSVSISEMTPLEFPEPEPDPEALSDEQTDAPSEGAIDVTQVDGTPIDDVIPTDVIPTDVIPTDMTQADTSQ